MNIYETIEARKSIRHYRLSAVEEEKLQRILQAASQAPSARNKQEWRFISVTQEETKALLAHEASQQHFIEKAPMVVVCCAVNGKIRMENGQPRALIDTAIAMDHLTLAAVEEGLGTCWIGSFKPDKVREILQIPPDIEVIEMVTLGYPAEEPAQESGEERKDSVRPPRDLPRKRKPLEQIHFREAWQ